MIERGFSEAEHLRANKTDVRKFAIDQARSLLAAAGVVDPVVKPDLTSSAEVATPLSPRIDALITEGRATMFDIQIGGKDKKKLLKEVKNVSNVSIYAESMVQNPDFTTLSEPETVQAVRLRVGDLMESTSLTTTRELFAKAEQEGLVKLPAEAALHQRLADQDQKLSDYYYMGHEPITDRYGSPYVFYLDRDGDGLWLYSRIAGSTDEWGPGHRVTFGLRKLE